LTIGGWPVEGRRLGKRSKAVRDRMSVELGLSGSAIDRVALDRLAQDKDFRERLRAFRAATELLDRWRAEFGGPVQRPQLHLRDGEQLTIYTRGGVHVIPNTAVLARPLSDGRFALDLQVAQGNEFLELEALRVVDGTEGWCADDQLFLDEVEAAGPHGAKRGG
jgi:hypothetical protein